MVKCDPHLMVNTVSVTRSHDAQISLQRSIVANSEAWGLRPQASCFACFRRMCRGVRCRKPDNRRRCEWSFIAAMRGRTTLCETRTHDKTG